jgi:hypothetical protein
LGILERPNRGTLSVGVPVSNQGDYLSYTLNSLLNQSISPTEIVVSDNHSRHHTYGLLLMQEYDELRLYRACSSREESFEKMFIKEVRNIL